MFLEHCISMQEMFQKRPFVKTKHVARTVHLLVWVDELAGNEIQVIPAAECEQARVESISHATGIIFTVPCVLEITQIACDCVECRRTQNE